MIRVNLLFGPQRCRTCGDQCPLRENSYRHGSRFPYDGSYFYPRDVVILFGRVNDPFQIEWSAHSRSISGLLFVPIFRKHCLFPLCFHHSTAQEGQPDFTIFK